MPPTANAHAKIEDLQALRGISIVLVVLYHLSLIPVVFAKFPQKVEIPFFLGVEIFFLISGYVVTLALFKDGFHGPQFLIKRVFRLTPVLVVFVVFSYGVVLAARAIVPPEAPFYGSFAPADASFFRQSAGILGGYYLLLDMPTSFHNGAMWSLTVEDQFYGAIALVCLVGVLLKRVARVPVQWWVGLVSAVMLTAIVWMRIRYFRGKTPAVYFPELLNYLFAWRFDFLALGVLLAMFDRSFPGTTRRFFEHRGPFLTGFLLLIPMVAAGLSESIYAPQKRLLFGVVMPITLVCFGLLVLLAGNNCAFPPSRGAIHRSLVWIGNRSYSYYVFHFSIILLAWLILFKWYPAALGPPMRYAKIQALIVIPLVMLIVEPIYRWIEMPLTRLGKRLVDGRKQIPSSETTVESEPLKIAA